MLSTKDPNNATTSYTYDDLNRLTKTTYPDGTNESKTYDSLGNLLSRTEPNGTTISYSYDSLNRLTKITYPHSITVTYTYDDAGNRLTKTDSGSTSYYSYDARNRLTNETDVIGGSTYTVLYTYDKVGNIVTLTYPDATTLTYTYDAMNRVKEVGGTATFSYTVDDKINNITYGNGVVTTYSYNNKDLPTQVLTETSGSAKLQDLNYTYDNASNVASIDSEIFHYDWLNRLTNSTGPWGIILYSYDAAGNIVSMTDNGVKTTYTYASYNRLTSVGSVNMTYDANGDMTKVVNGSNTWQYTYDYEGRLKSVTLNSAAVQTNVYDSDGKRVQQTDGSTTTTYVYEGANVIYQKNLNSGAIDKFAFANGLLVSEQCECGYTYYDHENAEGSVTVITEGTTNTLFTSNYLPYGTFYQRQGMTPVGYTGKPYDGATGLYYFGARFYDPAIQRFVTEDSVTGSTMDPQSLNRYVYALDNPFTIVDSTGHAGNPLGVQAESNANVAGNGINTIFSAIISLPSAISHVASGVPATRLASYGLVAGTVVAAVASTVFCPVASPALFGAAVGGVLCLAREGNNAQFSDVLGAEVAGGIVVGGGLAVGVVGGVVGSAVGQTVQIIGDRIEDGPSARLHVTAGGFMMNSLVSGGIGGFFGLGGDGETATSGNTESGGTNPSEPQTVNWGQVGNAVGSDLFGYLAQYMLPSSGLSLVEQATSQVTGGSGYPDYFY
jgi:RHS repeat-associated protein